MKILLAVDMSDFSEAAVQAVIAQFPPKGHEVCVFHSVDWERRLPASYLLAQGPLAARDVLDERDRLLREAGDYVDGVAARLRGAGFTVRTDLRPEGDPRAAILDVADAWPADLIVMGSHGRTGLDRFLLGSVSERVVRHAPCSVQIVRPPTTAAPRNP
jgi:nucleotide-binding universal stress UspA family protein